MRQPGSYLSLVLLWMGLGGGGGGCGVSDVTILKGSGRAPQNLSKLNRKKYTIITEHTQKVVISSLPVLSRLSVT
jgi:hypothetical protein